MERAWISSGKVVEASERVLARQGNVSTLEMLLETGLLRQAHIRDWKRGLLSHLEAAAIGNPEVWAQAIEAFHRWAEERKLEPELVDYPSMNRAGVRYLRFTDTGDKILEMHYRVAYNLPGWSGPGAEQTREPAVFWIVRESDCAGCQRKLYAGTFIVVEDGNARCLACTGLDHLVFLPAGNATLTRQTRELSSQSIIVLRYSRATGRYERKGLLVEPETVDYAFRVADAIRRIFPGCPPEDALAIAREFQPGQAADEESLRFAVRAALRRREGGMEEYEVWVRP